jgi:hypothetical protein
MEVEKRRRSSSDASMKEKRGKKVKAMVEVVPDEIESMEAETSKRVRKAPQAVYVPEVVKAGPSKKSKKKEAVVTAEAPRRKRIVTRRNVAAATPTEPLTLPPLKLSEKYFQEYREPLSIPSSLGSNKSRSKSSRKSRSSGERVVARDIVLVNRLRDITRAMEAMTVAEAPKVKLSKIVRPEQAQVLYKRYLATFKELQKTAKAILHKTSQINAVYITLKGKDLKKPEDIKAWLKTLEATKNVATIKSFQDMPDINEVLETYEHLRTRLLEVYQAEIKIFADLFDKHKEKHQKYFGKVYNKEPGMAVKDEDHYYLAYYEGMLEKLHDTLSAIREERDDRLDELNAFEETKLLLAPLQLEAEEIYEAYQKSVATLEKKKEENKQELDDLMALFGKL